VADAGVRPGELVVDIGAGDGVITGALVRAGARVLAVELHPGRAHNLATAFSGQPVSVLRMDALELRLPARPFRVVASPPYGISSALLRLLTCRGSRLVAADLVLQRAVVRRWSAGLPARWRAEPGRAVPRRAFRVPPKVDSGVLVIRRR
jgi:23S rRNA (adenine-N6)-dimethyltransferase